MWTIPNFTKQAIKISFIKLLNERPLNKISVRDIVEDCGINRNSFYYHFHDIPSLIEEIVMEEADMLIKQYPSIRSLNECVDVAFHFALENKKAVQHIYYSVNRDIYERYLMKMCDYVVTTYWDTAFGKENINELDREIIIRFFKCEIFGLSFEWITKGMQDDAIKDVYRLTKLCRGLSDELLKRCRESANS